MTDDVRLPHDGSIAFDLHPSHTAALPGRTARDAAARVAAFLYGLVAYSVFLGTILYAIGFVTGLVVPKTIDTGTTVPLTEALIVNVLLMSLFAVQHSVMARPQFKEWWTQYVPKSVERSTYVLLASLALVLLFWQWRPIPAVVWQRRRPARSRWRFSACRSSAG